jgi:hypothetical protein
MDKIDEILTQFFQTNPPKMPGLVYGVLIDGHLVHSRVSHFQ